MPLRSSAILLAAVGASLLCRFTERDVAFVDLGDEGYTLHVFVSAKEPPALAEELRTIGRAVFLDANVALDVVEVGDELPALLAEHAIDALPATVLVDPADHALVGALSREDEGARVKTLESFVSSPTRREIVDGVIESYGVVLLVEGSAEPASRAAENVIDGAFAEVAAIFDRMPKDVGDPPRQVTLPFARRAEERVLLWSLGLAELDPATPAVAIFMGRARRVGPVLVGSAITPASVFGILSVIGQSCECDLDRSWMQGPRIPLRWDTSTRERAVERIGFDPESPLVRSEILGILSRGPGARPREETQALSLEELLLGYEELVVEDPVREPPTVPGHSDPANSDGGEASPVAETVEPTEDFSPLDLRDRSRDERARGVVPWILLPLVCPVLGLGVIAIGIVLLVRRRKR